MVLPARAQVDAQLTQYWAVPAYYNPSAAGNIDFIHITAGSRLQWVGIHHAPMSFMALGDMPFRFFNNRWGTGVSIHSERAGLYRSLNAGVQLAWKKKIFHGTLSAGFQLGILSETFKGSEIIIPEDVDAFQSNDDAIPTNDVSGTAFDFSAGLMFTHKWFWAGFSSTHINAPSVSLKLENNEENYYEFNVGRLYYFMAGSNIPVKNTLFELQPSLMAKTDFNAWTAEVTARVRYNKFLSGGIGYRYKDAVSLQLGAEFKNFFIGYTYEYPTSAIRNASSGTHELFVTYNVKLDMNDKNKNKQKSIRIM